MSFLLIPISLISISIIGILAIVLRKKSHLNKLYTLDTAGNAGEPIVLNPVFSWKKYGEDFFPEIKVLFDRFEINKYKGHGLIEVEKILRRIRLVFLRIDRWSDTTIKKIRKIHVNNALNDSGRSGESSEIPNTIEANIEGAEPESAVPDTSISHAFLKNEEERLIIEIAKNPKNPKLYEELGDTYMEMRGFTDAKESYEAAIELNSQDEQLKLKLSSALEKLHTQK